MKNKSTKKIQIILIAIVFITVAISSGIIIANFEHVENCHILNCCYCNLINISEDFVKNLLFININILLLILTVPLILVANKKLDKVKRYTLVELKVIQNR